MPCDEVGYHSAPPVTTTTGQLIGDLQLVGPGRCYVRGILPFFPDGYAPELPALRSVGRDASLILGELNEWPRHIGGPIGPFHTPIGIRFRRLGPREALSASNPFWHFLDRRQRSSHSCSGVYLASGFRRQCRAVGLGFLTSQSKSMLACSSPVLKSESESFRLHAFH